CLAHHLLLPRSFSPRSHSIILDSRSHSSRRSICEVLFRSESAALGLRDGPKGFQKNLSVPESFSVLRVSCRTDHIREMQMTDYQPRADIEAVPALIALAPTEGQAFVAFNYAAERGEGAIPRKYRELIALGVALTTQCSYCIDVHTRHAREHDVTTE